MILPPFLDHVLSLNAPWQKQECDSVSGVAVVPAMGDVTSKHNNDKEAPQVSFNNDKEAPQVPFITPTHKRKSDTVSKSSLDGSVDSGSNMDEEEQTTVEQKRLKRAGTRKRRRAVKKKEKTRVREVLKTCHLEADMWQGSAVFSMLAWNLSFQ